MYTLLQGHKSAAVTHAQRHTHQITHKHTLISWSWCAMTQREAAGMKAPVLAVSCHHLD